MVVDNEIFDTRDFYRLTIIDNIIITIILWFANTIIF